MPVVRQREHDGIDVLAGHHLAVIVVAFAVFVLVMAVDGLQRFLQVAFVDVTGGHDLTILLLEKFVRVARAHHPPAKDGHGDAIGRGILAEHARWNDGGEADNSGGLQKVTAGGVGI